MKINRNIPTIAAIASVLIILSALFWYFILNYKSPSSNGSLKLSISSTISSLDPAKAFDNNSLKILGQSYETLYQYHYLIRPYKIIPLLAKKMPIISNNGKKYVIKIKEGIQYHDHPAFKGKRRFVRAQDFINQIKRLAFQPLNSTGKWIFQKRMKGFSHFSQTVGTSFDKLLNTDIEGLKASNDHTLIIELNSALPQLIYFLAMNFIVPIPIEVLRYQNNDLSSSIIGTGPYYLKDWNKDSSTIILKQFKKYRMDKYPALGDRYSFNNNLLEHQNETIPFIDEIRFYILKNEDLQWKKFMARELDILEIPRKQLEKILTASTNFQKQMEKEKIQFKYFSGLVARWIGFNMKDPLLGNNLYLRKAIAHAIDYEGYIKQITHNTSLRANSIFAPGIPGYDPESRLPYHYDLNLAKKYIEQAGYPLGKGLPSLTYSTRSDRQISIDEGEFIKAQLKKIGINLNIQVLKFTDFLQKGRNGQLQIWTDNWIYDYPDPENIIQLLISNNHPGINKSAYSNLKIDQLYALLNKETLSNIKLAQMKEIERIVNSDLPWIMLTYERSYVLHHYYVKNYRKASFIRNHLKYLKIEH